jgi:ATP-dependent RNA helicase DDX19/DBP5
MLEKAMAREGHKVVCLHGKNEASQRDEVIDAFRSGAAKVLITTNVLARGIDIAQVNLVINFDLPTDMQGRPDYETYLHRIGRTGRFGRMGVAINFVHDRDSLAVSRAMEKHFGREIVRVPTDDLMEVEDIFKKALKNK